MSFSIECQSFSFVNSEWLISDNIPLVSRALFITIMTNIRFYSESTTIQLAYKQANYPNKITEIFYLAIEFCQ